MPPTPSFSPSPTYYEYLLKVKLEFNPDNAQASAPSATQIATDAQTAIAADTTINANTVYVNPFVPAGSGE